MAAINETATTVPLQWRVSRTRKEYLQGKSPNPYQHHEWIDTRTLKMLIRRETEICNNPGYDGTSFPFMLNLMEYRVSGRPDLYSFKVINYYDYDWHEESGVEFERFKLEFEYSIIPYTKNSTTPYRAWFTGGKGYRLVYVPFVYTNLPILYLDPEGQYALKLRIKNKVDDERFKNLSSGEDALDFRSFLDPQVQAEGRGIKFDIMCHPKTKTFPYIPLGRGTAFQFILQTWLDLINLVEDRVEATLNQPGGFDILLKRPTEQEPPAICPPRNFATTKKAPALDNFNEPSICGVFCMTMDCTYRSYDKEKDLYVFGAGAEEICPIHERVHKTPKHYMLWSPKRMCSMRVYCFSTSETSSPLLYSGMIKVVAPAMKTPPSSKFLEGYPELQEQILVSNSYRSVEMEFLGDILSEPEVDKKNLIIVKSGMGTGKTVAVQRWLDKKNDPKLSVLCISTRQTCAGHFAAQFNCSPYINLGLDKGATQIHKRDLHKYKRLVISMESLHYLEVNGAYLHYDVIILDEIESILNILPSDTMNGKRRNFHILKELLKFANKIFAMDALLGHKTIHYFNNIRMMDNYSLIYNQKNRDESTYILYNRSQFIHWLERVYNDTAREDGKKVVLVADTKTILYGIVKRIFEEYKQKHSNTPYVESDKKYMVITGASDDPTKHTSVTTNAWEDLDLLCFTPTITVGNSFSPKDKKNYKWTEFGFFKGVTPAATSLQMMGRVRETISKEKHVFLWTPKAETFRPSKDSMDVEKVSTRIRKLPEEILKETQLISLERPLVVNRNFPPLTSVKKQRKELTQILEDYTVERSKSRDNVYKEFRRVLEEGQIKYKLFNDGKPLTPELGKASEALLNDLMKNESKEMNFVGLEPMRNDNALNASNMLIGLGAPLVNRQKIREKMTPEMFLEFQRSHYANASIHKNRYILETLLQNDPFFSLDIITQPDFIKGESLPDCLPLMARHLYFCFSDLLSEPPGYLDWKWFSESKDRLDALENYFSVVEKHATWEIFKELYPFGGSFTGKTQRTLFKNDFIRHLNFFGFPYEILSVREANKLRKQGVQGMPPRCHKKQLNIILRLNKEKNENTVILSRRLFGPQPFSIPDSYTYKTFFQQDSISDLSLVDAQQ